MLILSAIFIVFSFLLMVSFKNNNSQNFQSSKLLPISIIAAARNEEDYISEFINSIKQLEYPEENYELIIVDDNSTDQTFSKTQKLIARQSNFKIIKADNKFLKAKRGALQTGIEASKFPYILITDADCVVSTQWLKICSSVFQQGYDFIFGPAPFYEETTFINKVSCFENIRNQFLTFSFANIGLPYSASARNFGFTKESFAKVGGYKNTTDTLSGDDDLLLREAVKNKLEIKAFHNKDAFVYSRTKKNIKEYLKQKARHTQTSHFYSIKVKPVLGCWHLLNLFMFLSPVLMVFNINFIRLFVLKMLIDSITFYFVQKSFSYRFNILQIFYLDMIYEIFIVVNFFNSFFRKIEWK